MATLHHHHLTFWQHLPGSPEETDDDEEDEYEDDEYLDNDPDDDIDDHIDDDYEEEEEEVDLNNGNVVYLEQLLFCRIQNITQHWFGSHLHDDDENEDED